MLANQLPLISTSLARSARAKIRQHQSEISVVDNQNHHLKIKWQSKIKSLGVGFELGMFQYGSTNNSVATTSDNYPIG